MPIFLLRTATILICFVTLSTGTLHAKSPVSALGSFFNWTKPVGATLVSQLEPEEKASRTSRIVSHLRSAVLTVAAASSLGIFSPMPAFSVPPKNYTVANETDHRLRVLILNKSIRKQNGKEFVVYGIYNDYFHASNYTNPYYKAIPGALDSWISIHNMDSKDGVKGYGMNALVMHRSDNYSHMHIAFDRCSTTHRFDGKGANLRCKVDFSPNEGDKFLPTQEKEILLLVVEGVYKKYFENPAEEMSGFHFFDLKDPSITLSDH